MASPSERSRNNVRAGIFVTLAIVLAMLTIIALTKAWDRIVRPMNNYTVWFNVADGVKNIKGGAEVRVGGVAMGLVKDVKLRIKADEPLEFIDVDFALDKDVLLHNNATILLGSALIGADAWLDISSVGTADAALAKEKEPLPGYSGAGMLTAILGQANAEKADKIVEGALATVNNVQHLTGQITDEDWPEWSWRIDQIMEWALGATEKIDGVLDDGQVLFADLRSTVGVNRPRINAIVGNVEDASADVQEITRRLRQETVNKINSLLDRGLVALDRAVAILERVGRDYETWSTDIRDGLAGFRLMGQQLKLAMMEVRRSPWKLVYRPEKSEMEHELLYDATRTFALAVSDLRAAAESTERLVDNHGEEIEANPELLKQVSRFLCESLEHYQTAQQELIRVLQSDEHGPK